MNWQSLTVLALVVLAALYFGRGFVLGLLGRGRMRQRRQLLQLRLGRELHLSKLEELKRDYEARKAAGH